VQDSDISEVMTLINSKTAFTKEQIKGTLESFKNDKQKTVETLIYRMAEMAKKGK
jgi:predicted transcriptional regulator